MLAAQVTAGAGAVTRFRAAGAARARRARHALPREAARRSLAERRRAAAPARGDGDAERRDGADRRVARCHQRRRSRLCGRDRGARRRAALAPGRLSAAGPRARAGGGLGCHRDSAARAERRRDGRHARSWCSRSRTSAGPRTPTSPTGSPRRSPTGSPGSRGLKVIARSSAKQYKGTTQAAPADRAGARCGLRARGDSAVGEGRGHGEPGPGAARS